MSTPPINALNTEVQYLRSVRAHVLGIINGMSEDDLRRPVLPSGWTVLGLINHLTVDVEQFWFQAVVAGEIGAVARFENDTEDGDGSGWQTRETDVTCDLLDAYVTAARHSDAVIAHADADATPRWWPGSQFGEWRLHTVREVVLHVIVETASHAGHLDATRELVDGRQWLVLT